MSCSEWFSNVTLVINIAIVIYQTILFFILRRMGKIKWVDNDKSRMRNSQ